MDLLRKHIVLIGFKHVGKSVIGQSLALRLNSAFIDLDKQIELLYENKFNKKYTCREIMLHDGQDFFRRLEVDALRQIMASTPSVISLGSGAALYEENQKLIKSSILVQITASQDVVFERITQSGRPAFFNPEEDLLESFNQLWVKRNKIYENIHDFLIVNNSTVDEVVDKILKKINLEEQACEESFND